MAGRDTVRDESFLDDVRQALEPLMGQDERERATAGLREAIERMRAGDGEVDYYPLLDRALGATALAPVDKLRVTYDCLPVANFFDYELTSFGKALVNVPFELARQASAGSPRPYVQLLILAGEETFRAHQDELVAAADHWIATHMVALLATIHGDEYAALFEPLLAKIDDPYELFYAADHIVSVSPAHREICLARLRPHAVALVREEPNRSRILTLSRHLRLGFVDYRHRVVDWLLEHAGRDAKPWIKRYRTDNSALRAKYFEIVEARLGADSLDLLVGGLRTSIGKRYGFMDIRSYTKRLMRLIQRHDFSRYAERIRKKLADHEDRQVRNIVGQALAASNGQAQQAPEPPVLDDDERWLFDEQAAALQRRVVDTIAEQVDGAAGELTAIDVYLVGLAEDGDYGDEDEWGQPSAHEVVIVQGGEQRTLSFEHAVPDGWAGVSAFCRRHDYDDGDAAISWSDSQRVPLCIAILEHARAVATVSELLRRRAVAVADGVVPVFHHRHDSVADPEEYAAITERCLRYDLYTAAAAVELAYRCYRDAGKQRWLIGACELFGAAPAGPA